MRQDRIEVSGYPTEAFYRVGDLHPNSIAVAGIDNSRVQLQREGNRDLPCTLDRLLRNNRGLCIRQTDVCKDYMHYRTWW